MLRDDARDALTEAMSSTWADLGPVYVMGSFVAMFIDHKDVFGEGLRHFWESGGRFMVWQIVCIAAVAYARAWFVVQKEKMRFIIKGELESDQIRGGLFFRGYVINRGEEVDSARVVLKRFRRIDSAAREIIIEESRLKWSDGTETRNLKKSDTAMFDIAAFPPRSGTVMEIEHQTLPPGAYGFELFLVSGRKQLLDKAVEIRTELTDSHPPIVVLKS